MATVSQPASPPRKRRRFQYRLRTLLVVMLLASIGMSWFAVRLQRAKRQRAAVAGILKAGGVIKYDFQLDPSGNESPGAQAPGPAWLRTILGKDLLENVVAAHCCDDASASCLKDLPHLKRLSLWPDSHVLLAPPITDAGLEQISGLTELQALDVRFGEVTDAGIAYLEGLTQLQTLDLSDTKVSDAAIEHLRGMSQLRTLALSKTNVTDAGLRRLKPLPQVECLYLTGSEVTSAGVKELQQTWPNCWIER